MSGHVFGRAISLGCWCRPAFQIRRVFGKNVCTKGVFDWQITPEPTVAAYLERNFEGFLEREDLAVNSEGDITNTRYGSIHPHEFPQGIDQSYAAARARHDHLCGKLRRALSETVSTLFVALANDPETFKDRVEPLIRRINPDLPFHLYVVKHRPDLAPTREAESWQGNDDYWDAELSGFRIRSNALMRWSWRCTTLTSNAVKRSY